MLIPVRIQPKVGLGGAVLPYTYICLFIYIYIYIRTVDPEKKFCQGPFWAYLKRRFARKGGSVQNISISKSYVLKYRDKRRVFSVLDGMPEMFIHAISISLKLPILICSHLFEKQRTNPWIQLQRTKARSSKIKATCFYFHKKKAPVSLLEPPVRRSSSSGSTARSERERKRERERDYELCNIIPYLYTQRGML